MSDYSKLTDAELNERISEIQEVYVDWLSGDNNLILQSELAMEKLVWVGAHRLDQLQRAICEAWLMQSDLARIDKEGGE